MKHDAVVVLLSALIISYTNSLLTLNAIATYRVINATLLTAKYIVHPIT